MDETYGTYDGNECFDIHDYDDGTAHDTDDDNDDDDDDYDDDDDDDDDTSDDTSDDSDEATDDGGRGNRKLLPGGAEYIS